MVASLKAMHKMVLEKHLKKNLAKSMCLICEEIAEQAENYAKKKQEMYLDLEAEHLFL